MVLYRLILARLRRPLLGLIPAACAPAGLVLGLMFAHLRGQGAFDD